MDEEFKEDSRAGFMRNNGGFLFRQVSETEYEYKATVQEHHLNSSGITHGGYIMTLMDSGLGNGVFRQLGGELRIATISLDVKFIAPSHQGDTIVGTVRIIKKTRSMVFAQGDVRVKGNIIATADGIWKILTK